MTVLLRNGTLNLSLIATDRNRLAKISEDSAFL